jgi:hypothetical protein
VSHCYRKVKPEPTRRKTKRQRNGKFKTAVSSPSLPTTPRSPTISLSSTTASCAENLSSSSSEEGDDKADNDYVGNESAGATIAASVLTNFNTYAADGDNNSDTTMEPPPAKRRLTVHPSKRVVDIDLEAEDYQGPPPVHENAIVAYREVYKLGASQVARVRPDRMLSDDLISIAIKYALPCPTPPFSFFFAYSWPSLSSTTKGEYLHPGWPVRLPRSTSYLPIVWR